MRKLDWMFYIQTFFNHQRKISLCESLQNPHQNRLVDLGSNFSRNCSSLSMILICLMWTLIYYIGNHLNNSFILCTWTDLVTGINVYHDHAHWQRRRTRTIKLIISTEDRVQGGLFSFSTWEYWCFAAKVDNFQGLVSGKLDVSIDRNAKLRTHKTLKREIRLDSCFILNNNRDTDPQYWRKTITIGYL